MPRLTFTATLLAGLAVAIARAAEPAAMERIEVSSDKRGFVLAESGRPFVPWGFNYDHDRDGQLIEDYWDSDWPAVEGDFAEMRELHANVVRVHLQFGKFMQGPAEPNQQALDRLARLVALAERERLYLDLTGLGCYHKKDVPAWYDALDEAGRWEAQAQFWQAVAGRCAASGAIFCYDLMNEPVVPGGKRAAGDWLGPPFGDSHFVQCITLDQQDRPRSDIARAWIERLTKAIRQVDPKHLITVGMVDWSLDRPGLTSGFVPEKVAGELDFLATHIYPETGKLDAALTTLAGFAIGKPLIVEEMFPLSCRGSELEEFIDRSRPQACGWISFYWGKPPAELRQSPEMVDAVVLKWLEAAAAGKELGTPSPELVDAVVLQWLERFAAKGRALGVEGGEKHGDTDKSRHGDKEKGRQGE